jgi:acetyl-CoA carboxylase biotin carboxyl carrier protein
MDVRDIVELVNLVAAREIAEFELEREGIRLRIVRTVKPLHNGGGEAAAVTVPAVVERPAPAAESVAEDPSLFTMKCPIVGTFYRAPSPAAEPYVKVSDRVKQGQVLCIVEAMKLMNEIECEVAGTVVDVMVEDGQPVEYGEPLFKIRLDK